MRIQAKYQGIRKIAFLVFPSCQFSGFKLISAMSGVKLLIELPEEEVSFVYCGPLRPHAGQIPAPPLYFLQAQASAGLSPSSFLLVSAFDWNGPLSYGKNLISSFSLKILLFHFDHKWVMIRIDE